MKKLLFTLALICMTFIFQSQTSNTAPLKGVQVMLKPVANSTNYKIELKISVLQTTGIEHIYVKVGSTKGSNDIYNHTFNWDESSADYSRTGSVVTLQLGSSYSRLDKFFGEVSIGRDDAEHSISDPISFSR